MKKAVCLIFFILIVFQVLAQSDTLYRTSDGRKPYVKQKSRSKVKDKIFFGGNLGASFGSITFIDVSPLVGYKINDKFSVAIGSIYNYYSYSYAGYRYQLSMYGGRCFARYFLTENIFAQAGWDKINRDNPYSNYPGARVWVDNLLIGGGVKYPISDRLYCTAIGLWNLNQNDLSPYRNPIFQVGFIGGF